MDWSPVFRFCNTCPSPSSDPGVCVGSVAEWDPTSSTNSPEFAYEKMMELHHEGDKFEWLVEPMKIVATVAKKKITVQHKPRKTSVPHRAAAKDFPGLSIYPGLPQRDGFYKAFAKYTRQLSNRKKQERQKQRQQWRHEQHQQWRQQQLYQRQQQQELRQQQQELRQQQRQQQQELRQQSQQEQPQDEEWQAHANKFWDHQMADPNEIQLFEPKRLTRENSFVCDSCKIKR